MTGAVSDYKKWMEKGMLLTKVLKQLGLDGSTIGSFAKPNFSPGRTNNFEQRILISTK